ncbi:hypothetical protein SEUCBS140593_007251 [Sporothrix eucalyptigena]|uniref:Amine oxidase domain-containing protein n=1 Tax=Sporothrix eucalyptigena TaxID=1812306 RepID=A0ABP0CBP8_9PEZI
MFSKVWRLFCDLDGGDLVDNWKFAFGTHQSPKLVAEWDKLSCQDRLDQIRDRLTAEETAMLKGLLIQMGGTSLDEMGLVNALQWGVLGSHKPTGLNDIALHTRLRSGNSVLHRHIFEHALSTGNLSYSLDTPISRVEDAGDVVTVVSRAGQHFRAKSVICTIPLNVLASTDFSPPLPAGKLEAFREGSVNKCNKVHLDLNGPEYLSWSSFASPGKRMVCALGDCLTPADNSHLVAFGPNPNSPDGISLQDIDTIKSSVMHLLPKEKQSEAVVNRIVSIPTWWRRRL